MPQVKASRDYFEEVVSADGKYKIWYCKSCAGYSFGKGTFDRHLPGKRQGGPHKRGCMLDSGYLDHLERPAENLREIISLPPESLQTIFTPKESDEHSAALTANRLATSQATTKASDIVPAAIGGPNKPKTPREITEWVLSLIETNYSVPLLCDEVVRILLRDINDESTAFGCRQLFRRAFLHYAVDLERRVNEQEFDNWVKACFDNWVKGVLANPEPIFPNRRPPATEWKRFEPVISDGNTGKTPNWEKETESTLQVIKGSLLTFGLSKQDYTACHLYPMVPARHPVQGIDRQDLYSNPLLFPIPNDDGTTVFAGCNVAEMCRIEIVVKMLIDHQAYISSSLTPSLHPSILPLELVERSASDYDYVSRRTTIVSRDIKSLAMLIRSREGGFLPFDVADAEYLR